MGSGGYDEIDGLQGGGDPRTLLKFTTGIIFTQVVGLVMVSLAGLWMSNFYGGFGWDTKTVFNYHPLFMTMGFIFLYGDGNY
jgi:cytochrome b-561